MRSRLRVRRTIRTIRRHYTMQGGTLAPLLVGVVRQPRVETARPRDELVHPRFDPAVAKVDPDPVPAGHN